MCCFNYLPIWPRWKLIQLLISTFSAFPVACLKSSCQECHNLILVRISMYDLITILCFLQPSDSCLVKWKPLLFYGEVKELRLMFSLCVTMDLRDRVGKIVRMKNLKRWKFEEKWKFLRRPIKEWFRIRNPSNWEWMKIWKMTILNGQTKEWCWMRNVSRLKIDENLKDENFKWPNWGMILKQNASTRKWKKMTSFWWQNFLKK